MFPIENPSRRRASSLQSSSSSSLAIALLIAAGRQIPSRSSLSLCRPAAQSRGPRFAIARIAGVSTRAWTRVAVAIALYGIDFTCRCRYPPTFFLLSRAVRSRCRVLSKSILIYRTSPGGLTYLTRPRDGKEPQCRLIQFCRCPGI